MKPQLVFPIFLSFFHGLSTASIIKAPAPPRDEPAINEDPNTKSLTGNQPAYPLSTTTVSISMNTLTPVYSKGKTDDSCNGDGDGDTLQKKTSNELGRRQDGQPQQGGAGAGAGAGSGAEAGAGGQQGQQPEENKPTHAPLPTQPPSNNSGRKDSDRGAVIGGLIAAIVGVILVICVIKGIKARREDQEESDEEYEMRRQRRRSRR